MFLILWEYFKNHHKVLGGILAFMAMVSASIVAISAKIGVTATAITVFCSLGVLSLVAGLYLLQRSYRHIPNGAGTQFAVFGVTCLLAAMAVNFDAIRDARTAIRASSDPHFYFHNGHAEAGSELLNCLREDGWDFRNENAGSRNLGEEQKAANTMFIKFYEGDRVRADAIINAIEKRCDFDDDHTLVRVEMEGVDNTVPIDIEIWYGGDQKAEG